MLNSSKSVFRTLRFASTTPKPQPPKAKLPNKKPSASKKAKPNIPSKYGPPTWEYHGKKILEGCLIVGAAGGMLGLFWGAVEASLNSVSESGQTSSSRPRR